MCDLEAHSFHFGTMRGGFDPETLILLLLFHVCDTISPSNINFYYCIDVMEGKSFNYE